MISYLGVFINIILCSFFLFPIEFTFLPTGVNTKIIMSLIGLACLLRDMSNSFVIPDYIFRTYIYGALFSAAGLFSVFYNESSDYTYAGYIFSMSVWLSAAYFFITSVVAVHCKLSVPLVVKYLSVVCVLQCVSALVINFNPSVKIFVDSYVLLQFGSVEFLDDIERLYGLGAALDPAGVRFAVVIILITVLLKEAGEMVSLRMSLLLIVSLFIILTVGNMISRTTTMGVVLSICYLMYRIVVKGNFTRSIFGNPLLYLLLVLLTFFSLYLYSSLQDFRELFRYGFEAFFNLVEKGELTTGSTEKLNTMWVFPDNLKTWIIGDGWFNDPFIQGWYMSTDIGYLRFIFYSGLIGLSLFSVFNIVVAEACARLHSEYKIAFLLLLVLGFIVWIKVSTDLFQFYALFLSIAFYRDHNMKYKSVIK